MLLDSTSAEEILELLDPDLKEAIDYEFSRGEEEQLLKNLLKNIDEYIQELNTNLTPLTGMLEPFSGLFYQANLTTDIIDFWKPKRVRLHSIDSIYTFNNPLEDSVRYDDDFGLTKWCEYAYDSEYVTDSTSIDIVVMYVLTEEYNEHPGHYASVEQSPERLSVDGKEWQAGGFTPYDGPIDSTTGIDDPWVFDSPFGCDFCYIQSIDTTGALSVSFDSTAGADDYYWSTPGTFNNNSSIIYIGRSDSNNHGGFRFPNVNVEKGSTIINAYLRVMSNVTDSSTCNVKVYGNDIDNAVAPLNKTQANALELTTNFNNVSLSLWTANNWYEINCTQAVQEIVNRLGWSSGNALQIVILDNNTPGNHQRIIKSIESGEENKAQLHIEWITVP